MPNQSQAWALTDFAGPSRSGVGSDLLVTVNGVSLPIAQFTMTYGLNSIPSATAMIAMGRNARTGAASSIYTQAHQLSQMAPAKVEIRGPMGDWSPIGQSGRKISWPAGQHILFTGYVSGTSYKRAVGKIFLVLNLTHRLVDLAMSSGGSADVVPGAPNDLMLPTLAEGAGGAVAGTAGSKFTKELPDDLRDDFSNGILKCLHYVSQNNQLQTNEAWCTGDGPEAPANGIRANARAAQVIEGDGDWRGIRNYKTTSNYTKKYPLTIHTQGADYTASVLGSRIAGSLAGASMWSMLIGSLIPEFGVFLIPTAQDAYLAPVIPMSRQIGKTIYASEFVDFDMTAASQRPLFGVGVMSNYATASVARVPSDNKQCVGATYVARVNDDPDEVPQNDGMWLFVQAPGWMDDWANFDPEALNGDPAVNAMLGQAANDAVGGAPNKNVNRNPDDEVLKWNDVMRNFAQMMYASNALKGRQGRLTGKLRFDIAPGTTIRVSARDRSGGDKDQLPTDVYGLVSEVTTTIKSEPASCATTFSLTNLRSGLENDSARFSMDTHPFFGSNFFQSAPIVNTLDIP